MELAKQELVLDGITYVIRELGMEEGLKVIEGAAEGGGSKSFNARLLRASVFVDGMPIKNAPFRHVMKLLPVVMKIHGLGQTAEESEEEEPQALQAAE